MAAPYNVSEASGSPTFVSVATTDTAVLSTNSGRNMLVLSNDGANKIYISLKGAAVAGSGIVLVSGGPPLRIESFRGPVRAIAVTGTTNLCVQEI